MVFSTLKKVINYTAIGFVLFAFATYCRAQCPVGVPPIKIISMPNDTSICYGDYKLLFANAMGGTGVLKYVWSSMGVTLPNNYKYQPLSAGANTTMTWKCTVTDSLNCLVQDSFRLSVYDSLQVSITPPQSICLGNSAIINVISNIGGVPNGAPLYFWTPSHGGGTMVQGSSQIVQPTAQGVYTYWIYYNNGCNIPLSLFGKDSTTVTVDSISTFFQIWIPNAFTPGGKNPVFNVTFTSKLIDPDFEMYIFDYCGNEVFHTTDIRQGWDGSSTQSIGGANVYIYKISVKDNLGHIHNADNDSKMTGTVMLMK